MKRKKMMNEIKTDTEAGTTTRTQLVSAISKDTGLPTHVVGAVLDSCFDRIISDVRSGRKVKIRRFGTFSEKSSGPRTVFVPRTGECVDVEGRRTLRFTPGGFAKDL